MWSQMSEFKCSECERNFSSQEALDQHNRDKHSAGDQQSKHELKRQRKIEMGRQDNLERKSAARKKLMKRTAYLAIPVILIAAAFTFIASQPLGNPNSSNPDIPRSPIHWHPTLEIVIKGQNQVIPANLGLVGVEQPTHTHDSTGVLHYENNNPTFETMRLGYFFDKVWRKQFNSTCIMNYCNGDSGTVKMFVNSRENFDFENYIPKDKDEIRIEFS